MTLNAQTATSCESTAERRTASHTPQDWAALIGPLLAGDPEAVSRVNRLTTGLLASWRAYDFRDDWDDIVQEVGLAVIRSLREGRLRHPERIVGYVRTVAHNKFSDRLRAHVRRREDETVPWEEATRPARSREAADPAPEIRLDIRAALGKLPENKRNIVFAVYGEGKTYEQAARELGIPLGSAKRYLRDGLVVLRRELAAYVD